MLRVSSCSSFTFLLVVGLCFSPTNRPARAQSDLGKYNESLATDLADRAAKADAAALKRGGELFFSQRANCQGCHRIIGYGGMVGPDLSEIGKERTQKEMVESILWPDRKIAAKYRLTSILTDEGRQLQGWLQHETTKHVNLLEPTTGKVHVIKQASIEDRTDGGTLMPTGLTARLSHEEISQLVAFLSSLGKRPNDQIDLPAAITNSQSVVVPKGFEKVDVELNVGTVHEQMQFDRHWLRVMPNQKVKLTLKNTDRMQHNLVICDPSDQEDVASRVAKLAFALGAEAVERNYVPDVPYVLVNTPIVNPGQSATIFFHAPSREGDYPIVCTLPGHAVRMRSVLHVGEGDEPPKPKLAMHMHASAIERAKQPMQQYWQMSELRPMFSGVIDMQESVSKLTASKQQIDRPTHRGMAVRLGEGQDSAILFDADLMRYSAGWSGEFIKLREGREDERAEYRSSVGDRATFFTHPGPGWQHHGSWDDERPRRLGPLPREWAKYRGHYRSGNRVVFRYSVGDMNVLDSPWSVQVTEGSFAISRTFEFDPSSVDNTLHVAELLTDQVTITDKDGFHLLTQRDGNDTFAIALKCDNREARPKLVQRNGRCELTLPRHDNSLRCKLYLWRGEHSHLQAFKKAVQADDTSQDLKSLASGGPSQWSESIITRGVIGESKGSFAVDTLTLPFENPWKSLLYTSGLDFFRNGDGALCTSHGDVWTVTGIDEKLDRLMWRKIASGLANPLGLKIVDDSVYVTCLDQIVKLHDLNGDQEIDYYECFNNDCQVSHQHHRFATGLETDSAGNFYYCKCSEEGGTDHGGTMIRVSPDGERFGTIATGLRNPNGMGIGPDDLITFSKQQGGWIPSSAIHVVKPGGFYGYMPSHHRETPPEQFENPLCWIPHGVDNSSGGQVWIPKNAAWGSLSGKMLHLSYGQCRMFLVLQEQVGNEYQGGIVPIPDVEFQSGAMRARFRKQDGELYVTGLRGWQTSAAWAGCLQRVRYTGNHNGTNCYLPTALHARPGEIEISFSAPLDASVATEISRYKIRQWNYQWTKNYGSKDYSVAEPDKQGRDDVNVTSVQISPDRKTVVLKIPGLQTVMQMMIDYDILAADGEKMIGPIFNTINRLEPAPHGGE